MMRLDDLMALLSIRQGFLFWTFCPLHRSFLNTVIAFRDTNPKPLFLTFH